MKHLVVILRLILGLTVNLFTPSVLWAQQETEFRSGLETENPISEEITAISVGDRMPELKFTNILNYKTKTARLSDFKGKVVLIDFWATWCISCVSSFPKIEAFQKKFKDRLQILLVNNKGTGDDEKKIVTFFEKRRNKNGEKYKLTIITGDTVLSKLFPSRLLPHYVWIGKDGFVRAITSSEYVTIGNIEKLIKNEHLILPVKKDLDPTNPLYLTGGISLDDLMQYSIFVKGRIDGLGSSSKLRKSGKFIRGKAMTNIPLLNMYKYVAINLMNKYHDKRLLIEVSDISKLIRDTSKSEKDAWNKENFYTYELILPISEVSKLDTYMLEDLNRYSDYHGEIKKIKTKCLALVRTSQNDKLQSKGGKPQYRLYNRENPYVKNVPIGQIISKLNSIEDISLFIIDETDYKGNVDIEFKLNPDNKEKLVKELNRYDLTLVEVIRDLDMFVLTDKVKKPSPESKTMSSK